MKKYFPSEEQVAYARHHFNESVSNLKVFFKTPDDEQRQFFGFLGETLVCDLLGLPRSAFKGYDGGWDIDYQGLRIDVKTRTGTVAYQKNFVHNVAGRQSVFDAQAYLFLYYNRTGGYFHVCGWLKKGDFYERATFTPSGGTRTRNDGSVLTVKGPAGMYEVEQKDLDDFKIPEVTT